jgi:hypothetical protein
MLPSYRIDYKTLYERERELVNGFIEYRQRWLVEESEQWTPVSSGKLPEECGTVLVYGRELDPDGTPACSGCDGCGGFIESAGWIPEGKQFFVEGNDWTDVVTHWRTLPASPNVNRKKGGEA